MSLTLLYKLSTSEFNFSDHMATLLTLLHTLLYEQKPTIVEFALALSFYSQLLGHAQSELTNNKMTFNIIHQVCGLVANVLKEEDEEKNKRRNSKKEVILSACLGFLNDLMKL